MLRSAKFDNNDRSGFIPSANENHFQDLVDDYDVFTGNAERVFVSTGDVDDVVNRDDALESSNALSGNSMEDLCLFVFVFSVNL